MAYDYLGLTNDVCARLNETQLTSSNFTSAVGFYSQIKEAVNSSIRYINQSHDNWPFNHNTQEKTLVAGTTRYAFELDTRRVDFDTFRIKRDVSLDVGSGYRLDPITYDEYIDRYIDQEYETDTSKGGVPEYVFRTQDEKFGVVPFPDQAYTIEYEYFSFQDDLVSATDTTNIPERYRHVIIDGAMYYAYMFRDNVEQAGFSLRKFDQGVVNMRKQLVNENLYVRAV